MAVVAPPNTNVFQVLDEAEPVTMRTGAINRYFLGIKGEFPPGPEAFLAECVEGHEVDSHFHRIDQYQILLGSPGAYYQRTPLSKALLQYTDAYSVYGPFGAGPDDRMYFFTLRGAPSDIHGSMPKFRDELLYRGKRHHLIDLEPYINKGAPGKGDVVVDTLIEPEPDGLAAFAVRIGPGTETAPPAGELGTGRYTVVLDGEVNYDGRTFGPKSVGWTGGDAPELVLQGGPDGAVVVFLHMPFPDTPSVNLKTA